MPELKRPLSPYAAVADEPKPETVHDNGDRNDAAFGFPGEGDDEDVSDDDALPRTDIDDYDDYSDDKKKKVDDKERPDDDADDYGGNEKESDEEKSDEERGDVYDEYKTEIKSRAENDYEKDDDEKSEEIVEKREEVVEENEPKPQESHDDEYENDYAVKPVAQDTVAQDNAAESEFEDNFGHMNFGAYSDNAPKFTEKKFDESWGETETQENKADEEHVEPVIDTIKTVDESVPTDVDTTGQASTAQYDNQGLSAPERPFSPVEVPKMPIEETRPMSPIQHDEKPRPVGTKRSGVGYYFLLILLIGLSIFTLWLYQKKNGGTVPFLGLGEKVEVVEPDEPVNLYEEPDVPVALPEQNAPDVYEPVWTEPEPAPIVAPAPVDKPIEVRYPNDDILRGGEPDVRVIESEEDVLARKAPYGVSRDDKPILVEVTEPVVEIVTEEPVIEVTTVTAPDVIVEENVVSVPMPAMGEDVETVVEYDNPANVEYVAESYVYEGPQYVPKPAYVPAPQPQYVTESYDYVAEPEPGPETRRDFSVHDGGQYSVTETVTYRAN